MAQPRPFDVVVVARRAALDCDRWNVSAGVVAERHRGAGTGDGERDVGAARRSTQAVVLVPRLVDRDLRFVASGRDARRRERVDPVVVLVAHERGQAFGSPVARTTDLRVEAAGDGRDDVAGAAGAVREPLGLVVEVELDGRGRREVERDVRPARRAAGSVALVPRAVERDLPLPVACRQRERARPDAIWLCRQVGRRAIGGPIAGAAEAALKVPNQGYGRGRGTHRCRSDHPGDAWQHATQQHTETEEYGQVQMPEDAQASMTRSHPNLQCRGSRALRALERTGALPGRGSPRIGRQRVSSVLTRAVETAAGDVRSSSPG